MMNDFSLYFPLGWEHILDLNGYDHILFILVLCCAYTLRDWKKVLGLITAFTLGHCATLALAVFKVVRVNVSWVEFLIPLTIFLTAIFNLLPKRSSNASIGLYSATLFFGLIHGLGFSNYLQSLLGKEENVVVPLLAFNLGVECGQILVVLLTMVLTTLLLRMTTIRQQQIALYLSIAVIGVSFYLMLERYPL
ncbi:HupE/UreJ family protein [Sphingobacterium suaedae]|uniref:HupE/UreJ family protein n=1 Tax=Sphingobacterium suaedae TaxID=1686402 RepID=A0ABW5KL67_9SPHI